MLRLGSKGLAVSTGPLVTWGQGEECGHGLRGGSSPECVEEVDVAKALGRSNEATEPSSQPCSLVLGEKLEVETRDRIDECEEVDRKVLLLTKRLFALSEREPLEDLLVCFLTRLPSRGVEPCWSSVVACRFAMNPRPSMLNIKLLELCTAVHFQIKGCLLGFGTSRLYRLRR